MKKRSVSEVHRCQADICRAWSLWRADRIIGAKHLYPFRLNCSDDDASNRVRKGNHYSRTAMPVPKSP